MNFSLQPCIYMRIVFLTCRPPLNSSAELNISVEPIVTLLAPPLVRVHRISTTFTMYVCMYVLYVCMYVCMYVYMYVCRCVCVYVLYVCTYGHMDGCMVSVHLLIILHYIHIQHTQVMSLTTHHLTLVSLTTHHHTLVPLTTHHLTPVSLTTHRHTVGYHWSLRQQ